LVGNLSHIGSINLPAQVDAANTAKAKAYASLGLRAPRVVNRVAFEDMSAADVLGRLQAIEEQLAAAPLVAVAKRAVAYVKEFGKYPTNTTGDWKGLGEQTHKARAQFRAGKVFPAEFMTVIDSDPILAAWWREPKKVKRIGLDEKLELLRRRVTSSPNTPITQGESYDGVKIGSIVDGLRRARKAGKLSVEFIAACDAVDPSILIVQTNAEANRRLAADPEFLAKRGEAIRAAQRRPEVRAAKAAGNTEAHRRRREFCVLIGLKKPGCNFVNMDREAFLAWEAVKYPATTSPAAP
jgi:hypothetical protein